VVQALSNELLVSAAFGVLEVNTIDRGIPLATWSSVPPTEAIADFLRRKIVTRAQFDQMTDAAKRQAFTMAGLTRQYTLTRVHSLIGSALDSGESGRLTQKKLRTALANMGIGSKPWHLETVVRTNTQSAYMAGRHAQLKRVARQRPFWEYSTVGDDRVRPTHAAQNGRIFPQDDAYWNRWFPPNGYNCRCTVISLSQKEAERRGAVVSQPTTDNPDVGFASRPRNIRKTQALEDRVQTAITKAPILQPPQLSRSAGKVYRSTGGLGAIDDARRAAIVDKSAKVALSPGDLQGLRGTLRAAPLSRRMTGATQIAIPFPSVFADALPQLIQRLAQEPALKRVLRSLRTGWSAVFDSRVSSATRADVVVSGGITKSNEVVLSLTVRNRDELGNALQIAKAAQAGQDALRRAPSVAAVIARGPLVDGGAVKGYRVAWRNVRKAKQGELMRLSPEKLPGWTSEKVLVTNEQFADMVAAKRQR